MQKSHLALGQIVFWKERGSNWSPVIWLGYFDLNWGRLVNDTAIQEGIFIVVSGYYISADCGVPESLRGPWLQVDYNLKREITFCFILVFILTWYHKVSRENLKLQLYL